MNSDKSVVVTAAPGSIANLGALFDLAALAIKEKKDIIKVRLIEEKGIHVISTDPSIPSGRKNIAYFVAKEFFERIGIQEVGLEITVHKGVDVGVGLGSSGATAVAVALALNVLFNTKMRSEELIEIAGKGEGAIAGSPHYDNVSASMLGGLVIILRRRPLKIVKLKFPNDIIVVHIMPKIEVKGAKTKFFRSVLPRTITLEEHVEEVANAIKFVKAIYENNLEELGEATCNGGVVEKERSKYIPNYWKIKDIALKCGALGYNISGAGPSMFALVRENEKEEFLERFYSRLSKLEGEYHVEILHPNNEGAQVLEVY
ncbi:MAG: homoserine kinase [Thermoprotei archaeon]|nr:MAG: homoserine kinase [Thermoprotei archaeon]